jgi:hypothetical protein
MTRAELKAVIDAGGGIKGCIYGYKDPKKAQWEAAWHEAFNQYNAVNPKQTLRFSSCGSCKRKVHEWLSK